MISECSRLVEEAESLPYIDVTGDVMLIYKIICTAKIEGIKGILRLQKIEKPLANTKACARSLVIQLYAIPKGQAHRNPVINIICRKLLPKFLNL